MQRNSDSSNIDFCTSPEVSVDVNYNLKCKNSGHYKDSRVTDSYQNEKGMENVKQEISYDCSALDIDRLRIGDGKVVPRNVIGIQEPDNDITNRPGKCSALDRSTPTYRWHSAHESEENHHTFSKKRSVSNTSVIPRRNKPPEENANKEYFISFHRSLKLLGIQPKDFGINNEINTSNLHTSSLRVGPTFHTRLTNRSFSLENLRSVIQDQIGDAQRTSGEHVDHKILSIAVYEEWYFQKLEEARRRRKAQDINDQRKKEHSEKVKTEQKQKAEENFSEWKALKSKQKQQWQRQQQQKKKLENKTEGYYRLTDGTKGKPNQEEAFLLWKREKDKLLKQKKLEQKIQKKTTKSDKEKKDGTEMAFKLWKKQADQTLKEKVQKEERKKQEEEEAKKEKERMKRESAKSSFNAWKKRKDSELKKKIKEDKLAEEQKTNEKLMQQAERLYEAELVFEEWLAQTEERRNRQMDVIRKQKQKDQHKLPWKPGGFVPW